MRIFLATGLTLVAFSVPAAALASTPTRQHVAQYRHLYRAVGQKFGHRTPGRNIIRWGLSSGRKASDTDVMRSIDVLQRMLTPPPVVHYAPAPVASTASAPSTTTAPVAQSSAPTSYGGGGLANVPGVPASFAACVAMRESTDGAGSSNIYGILGSGGQGSLSQQKAAFSSMYAARGAEPWAPYDGC